MDNIEKFIHRLKNLNLDVTLSSNIPWIYLHAINGVNVKEKFNSKHGFCIGYMPIKNTDSHFRFSDINKMFNLIRKYIHNPKQQ